MTDLVDRDELRRRLVALQNEILHLTHGAFTSRMVDLIFEQVQRELRNMDFEGRTDASDDTRYPLNVVTYDDGKPEIIKIGAAGYIRGNCKNPGSAHNGLHEFIPGICIDWEDGQ